MFRGRTLIQNVSWRVSSLALTATKHTKLNSFIIIQLFIESYAYEPEEDITNYWSLDGGSRIGKMRLMMERKGTIKRDK